MARFSRLEVLNRIVEVGLVPVFYHGDIEVVSEAVAAYSAGGVTLFEFTNRGDHAIEVFRALERRAAQHAPTLILGAGSIVDQATAALFVAHGANFIVGPSFNERVARFCNRRKIAYLPGCATANAASSSPSGPRPARSRSNPKDFCRSKHTSSRSTNLIEASGALAPI